MKKLKIKQFITEEAKEILFELMGRKQKTLLIAAMKAGKTTFVMNYLFNSFRQLGIQLIFVSPTNSLLDDIQSKYKVVKCNGNCKSIRLNNLIPVISTPDSLHKTIIACEESRQQYMICYDEIHMVITENNFRDALKNPFLVYENELCVGLLGMTATPEPLQNMDFESVFYVDIENKFYVCDNTKIIENFINNNDNILNIIKAIKAKHENKMVVARINNKETIKLLNGRLKNSIAWYRANEMEEGKSYIHDMDIFEKTLEGNNIENVDYILTSSLGDVGVEYKLQEKPIVVDFIDNNSCLVSDVQFAGRFRNGIDTLYFVGKFETDADKYINKPPKQNIEYDESLSRAKAIIEILKNDTITEEIKGIKGIKTIKDDAGNFELKLDTWDLKYHAFKKTIRFNIQKAFLFKKYLKNHLTFNTHNIEILDFLEMEIKEGDELKKEAKALREAQKEMESRFLEEVEKIQDDKILDIILNRNLYSDDEFWKVKDYKELIDFWEGENLKDYRERYLDLNNTLKNYKNKKTNIELLEISLKSTTINEIKKQLAYISYNVIYDRDDGKEMENYKLEKDMRIVYIIRDYINKNKHKELEVYLSKKFKNELFEELQKEKSLSKLTLNSLDKHLRRIYNISNNRKMDIIKSIKNTL